jgi:hypothetical protein
MTSNRPWLGEGVEALPVEAVATARGLVPTVPIPHKPFVKDL